MGVEKPAINIRYRDYSSFQGLEPLYALVVSMLLWYGRPRPYTPEMSGEDAHPTIGDNLFYGKFTINLCVLYNEIQYDKLRYLLFLDAVLLVDNAGSSWAHKERNLL
ncbi:hypothetical protein NUACC26_067810 [Scytonema sp. NUACC26]